jgi:hypothetical protein
MGRAGERSFRRCRLWQARYTAEASGIGRLPDRETPDSTTTLRPCLDVRCCAAHPMPRRAYNTFSERLKPAFAATL